MDRKNKLLFPLTTWRPSSTSPNQIELTVNSQKVMAAAGQTILDVVRERKLDDIPTLCHDPSSNPKRYAAEEIGPVLEKPAVKASGRRVAVVGGGPAD